MNFCLATTLSALAYIKLQQYQHALETMKRELELVPQNPEMRTFLDRLQGRFSASPK